LLPKRLATRELIEGKPVNIAIHQTAEGAVNRIVIYGPGIKADISDPTPETISVFNTEIQAIIKSRIQQ